MYETYESKWKYELNCLHEDGKELKHLTYTLMHIGFFSEFTSHTHEYTHTYTHVCMSICIYKFVGISDGVHMHVYWYSFYRFLSGCDFYKNYLYKSAHLCWSRRQKEEKKKGLSRAKHIRIFYRPFVDSICGVTCNLWTVVLRHVWVCSYIKRKTYFI